MAESIVQDWLAEYETLQTSELSAFVSMHDNNQEIAEAIYTILNERLKYPELIHAICYQFHKFYRSNEEGLRKFTLQFIPILIYIYLNSVAMNDKKNCRSVETLLICIYNVEVSTEEGSPKIVSFRMPVLAQASIYHEEKSLHATDLRRWEENCNRDIKWGPYAQIESINAQNRMKVMTALLFSYNQQLSLIQKSALFHLCRIASQIVNQGFSKPGHAHRLSYGTDPNSATAPKPLPRIPMSSQFLIELVHAIYFAMFNEFGTIAIQTLEDIHNRACYEMFTDLILVTNAVKNSLHANPSGQPSDGPMGLSVALTPATNTVTTISKSMITNASFRTKKLPDDIPIIQGDDSQGLLTSITEETEQTVGVRNSIIRSSKEGIKAQAHKALIAGFKKSKDKDKEKDTKSTLNKINSMNEIKEVTPPKPPIRKDKFTNRNSIVVQISETASEYEKSPVIKQISKQQLIESNINGLNNITTSNTIPTTVMDMVQMQNLTNGGFNESTMENITSESPVNGGGDINDSIELRRSSITIGDNNHTTNHHMQISHV